MSVFKEFEFLMYAKDNLFKLKKYINSSNVNITDNEGATPLHYAACNESYNIAKYLISIGADINIQDTLNGWTPLHGANYYTKPMVTKLLIENGAKLDLKDKDGKTVRHWAIQYGHNKIVELIDNAVEIRRKAEAKREAEDNKISVEREAEEKRKEADGNYIHNGNIIIKLYSYKKLNKSANIYVQFNIKNQNDKIIKSEVIKSQSPQWNCVLNDKLYMNNRQVELIEIKIYEKRIFMWDKLLGDSDISVRYFTPGVYRFVRSEVNNEESEVIGNISLDIKFISHENQDKNEEAI